MVWENNFYRKETMEELANEKSELERYNREQAQNPPAPDPRDVRMDEIEAALIELAAMQEANTNG